MITFKQFINEAELPDLVEIIKRDCKQATNSKVHLYRGISSVDFADNEKCKVGDYVLKTARIKVRKNRVPKDTPKWAHEAIDDIFEEKFGERLRSTSLFCYPNSLDANRYGNNTCLIFPIGSYEMFYSKKVEDLTPYLFPDQQSKNDIGPLGGNKYKGLTLEEQHDLLKRMIDEAKYTRGTSPSKNKEVMVQCSEYYAIDIGDLFDDERDDIIGMLT